MRDCERVISGLFLEAELKDARRDCGNCQVIALKCQMKTMAFNWCGHIFTDMFKEHRIIACDLS